MFEAFSCTAPTLSRRTVLQSWLEEVPSVLDGISSANAPLRTSFMERKEFLQYLEGSAPLGACVITGKSSKIVAKTQLDFEEASVRAQRCCIVAVSY